MAVERRFADFYKGALPFQMDRIPEGGMCLSVFLALWKGRESNVLLGKVNPNWDWVRIGALSKERAEKISNRWMLPSSHLLLYESPRDAADRVLKEQLGLAWTDLGSPKFKVFSEAYSKPKHWDTEFVFSGEVSHLPKSPAWRELTFIDVSKTPDSEFARNHQDILDELGLR
jgi:ADP-ribose pyrophosphatase YjhB (NUDIX family)